LYTVTLSLCLLLKLNDDDDDDDEDPDIPSQFASRPAACHSHGLLVL